MRRPSASLCRDFLPREIKELDSRALMSIQSRAPATRLEIFYMGPRPFSDGYPGSLTTAGPSAWWQSGGRALRVIVLPGNQSFGTCCKNHGVSMSALHNFLPRLEVRIRSLVGLSPPIVSTNLDEPGAVE
jgi:hypothetical protein